MIGDGPLPCGAWLGAWASARTALNVKLTAIPTMSFSRTDKRRMSRRSIKAIARISISAHSVSSSVVMVVSVMRHRRSGATPANAYGTKLGNRQWETIDIAGNYENIAD